MESPPFVSRWFRDARYSSACVAEQRLYAHALLCRTYLPPLRRREYLTGSSPAFDGKTAFLKVTSERSAWRYSARLTRRFTRGST